MNFGIVGFGRMGQVYKRILEDLCIKFEFIVDVNPEKIDENQLIFSDYKEALESKKIDGPKSVNNNIEYQLPSGEIKEMGVSTKSYNLVLIQDAFKLVTSLDFNLKE